MENEALLSVENLRMDFPVFGSGVLRRKTSSVHAVDNVSFKIRKGQTLGMVGESGCGKTTVGRCIVRLYKPTDGQIVYNGENIEKKRSDALLKLRRNVQMIFQDPYSSLNPRRTVHSVLEEVLANHKLYQNKSERMERIYELVEQVGLRRDHISRYPHEFSGGQRQRISIARALAVEPELIICDEPVSALDVSVQAQVLNLFRRLKAELDLTYLFISHDLGVVRYVSDVIVVMYLGKIVESAPARGLFDSPLHPYTKALLTAVPVADPLLQAGRKKIILEGDVPSPINPKPGCRFAPRCPQVIDICKTEVPQLRKTIEEHFVACHVVNQSYKSPRHQ